MVSKQVRSSLRVGACVVLSLLHVNRAHADPFSASTTYRESKKITAISPTVPFTRTYQALSQDSKDLTFQEMDSGRIFLAFSSQDGTMDNLSSNLCSGTTNFQVYWVDKYADLPGVCVSATNGGAQGNSHSINPRIGGADGDEGRYVAYESDATNLFTFAGSPHSHQIYVHDRKWSYNYPSTSKCDPDKNSDVIQGANGPSYLYGISDDGKFLLFSTSATNAIDNLNPTCTDAGSEIDVFLRDGSNCSDGQIGACYTSVLFDATGYHTDPDIKYTLDQDSQNVSMTPDQSVVVFDTEATNPSYFNPDIRGHKDVYYHVDERFKKISQTMLPLCDIEGSLLPLTNEFGMADGDSERPSVSESGRYVAFDSVATDLMVWEGNPAMVCSTPGAPHPATFEYIDTNGFRQIYVYDHLLKKIKMVSLAYESDSTARREGANGDSRNARISRDGRFVVFESEATNLLATATTAHRNIFMYDSYFEEVYLVTPGTGGSGLDADATLTHISPKALSVAFQTRASDVVTENASQGGTGPTCGGQRCQQVYLARHSCPLDTDDDLVPDCLDECPNDSLKTEPQQCGCGVSEVDADSDFTPDCIDECDSDANKTEPESCGCGVAETDTDGDDTANCVDSCPLDGNKTTAGTCGCGVADDDTDGDGAADCVDSCPTDANKVGPSACPCGSLKNNPGTCGCNVADTDANKNGQADCLDPTSSTLPTAASYEVVPISLVSGKTYFVVRIKMQAFGGKNEYSYRLSKAGLTVARTSTSPTIVLNNIPQGTYTFRYSVSTGRGAAKTTTKTRSTTIRVK